MKLNGTKLVETLSSSDKLRQTIFFKFLYNTMYVCSSINARIIYKFADSFFFFLRNKLTVKHTLNVNILKRIYLVHSKALPQQGSGLRFDYPSWKSQRIMMMHRNRIYRIRDILSPSKTQYKHTSNVDSFLVGESVVLTRTFW